MLITCLFVFCVVLGGFTFYLTLTISRDYPFYGFISVAVCFSCILVGYFFLYPNLEEDEYKRNEALVLITQFDVEDIKSCLGDKNVQHTLKTKKGLNETKRCLFKAKQAEILDKIKLIESIE